MCPFTVSWQILQHIKNVIYNILFFYRQIHMNQILVSFTWPIMSLFKMSSNSSNLLWRILGDVDRISCVSCISLCCNTIIPITNFVVSNQPVLFNSKVVFSTISPARFKVLSVELLKIAVFLDVMMHHWVSSSQQLR